MMFLGIICTAFTLLLGLLLVEALLLAALALAVIRVLLVVLCEGLRLLVEGGVLLSAALLSLREALSAVQRRIVALFLIVLLLNLPALVLPTCVSEMLLGRVVRVCVVTVVALAPTCIVLVVVVVGVQECPVVLRELLLRLVALFLIEVLLLFCELSVASSDTLNLLLAKAIV
jgi:hypothetical protein